MLCLMRDQPHTCLLGLLASHPWIGRLIMALRPLFCIGIEQSILVDARTCCFTIDPSPDTLPGDVLPSHDPPGRSPPPVERSDSFR